MRMISRSHLNSIWVCEGLSLAWSPNCSCWSHWELMATWYLLTATCIWQVGAPLSELYFIFWFLIFSHLHCCGEAKGTTQCCSRMLCIVVLDFSHTKPYVPSTTTLLSWLSTYDLHYVHLFRHSYTPRYVAQVKTGACKSGLGAGQAGSRW
jgi:hypothetical protein